MLNTCVRIEVRVKDGGLRKHYLRPEMELLKYIFAIHRW